jgi:hypothetical protein
MKNLLKKAALTLVVAALTGAAVPSFGQSTNKAAVPAAATDKKKGTEKSEAAKVETKQTTGPFRGKLAELNKTAKTVTVGKRTFHVSSETKIIKAGKPATLEDGVIGEECSGGFKTSDDGKLVATKLTFGPKQTAAKTAEKKK